MFGLLTLISNQVAMLKSCIVRLIADYFCRVHANFRPMLGSSIRFYSRLLLLQGKQWAEQWNRKSSHQFSREISLKDSSRQFCGYSTCQLFWSLPGSILCSGPFLNASLCELSSMMDVRIAQWIAHGCQDSSVLRFLRIDPMVSGSSPTSA